MQKINVFPLNFDRRVTLCGSNLYPSPEIHPTRMMPEHDLLFINSGTWSVATEDEIFPNLTAGDIVFLRAGMKHRGISKCSLNAHTQYVHFTSHPQDRATASDSFVHSRGNTAYLTFPTLIHCNDISHIEEIMNQMSNVFWGHREDKQRTLNMMLNLLLNEVSYYASHEVPKDSEWCSMIIQLFMEDPSLTYSVEELAAELGTSPRTLSSRFSQTMGTSIRQYQINLKLEQAYTALCGSGMAVKDIAEKYGFCDAYYFSRMFKKKYGFSPNQIKNQNPSTRQRML